jgi:hypothetical protein
MNLLIESVIHFKSCDKFKNFYDKKKNGKSAGKVRIAMVRKVLVAIYHMLRKEEYFYYIDNNSHYIKLDSYEKYLKKVA